MATATSELDKEISDADQQIEMLENQLLKARAMRAELIRKKSAAVDKKGQFIDAIQRGSLPDTSMILQLLKWNTPTISNGWEQITKNPMYGRECFNLEPIIDHMPQMGPLVGFAVTVTIRPGDHSVPKLHSANRQGFRDHVASLPAGLPKIIVVQDEDKPLILGSMWGEVNATFFRSLGVAGCIVDGGGRDLDEMTSVGLHAMSRGVCIGHAFGGIPVTWDIPIQVFGVTVRPGQLIHADKHGFLVVPEEDEQELLEASEFMDNLERKHTIVPGKEGISKSPFEISKAMNEANRAFAEAKKQRYGTYEERFGDGNPKKLRKHV